MYKPLKAGVRFRGVSLVEMSCLLNGSRLTGNRLTTASFMSATNLIHSPKLRPLHLLSPTAVYAAVCACTESKTISPRVLLTIAFSSACSSAGTANLSSVC